MSHKEKRLSLKKKVESAPSQHIEDDLHGDNSHVFITRDGHTKIVSKSVGSCIVCIKIKRMV